MTVKICNRCKTIVEEFSSHNYIVNATYEGSGVFEWIVGQKYQIDLCKSCWESWLLLANSPSPQERNI